MSYSPLHRSIFNKIKAQPYYAPSNERLFHDWLDQLIKISDYRGVKYHELDAKKRKQVREWMGELVKAEAPNPRRLEKLKQGLKSFFKPSMFLEWRTTLALVLLQAQGKIKSIDYPVQDSSNDNLGIDTMAECRPYAQSGRRWFPIQVKTSSDSKNGVIQLHLSDSFMNKLKAEQNTETAFNHLKANKNEGRLHRKISIVAPLNLTLDELTKRIEQLRKKMLRKKLIVKSGTEDFSSLSRPAKIAKLIDCGIFANLPPKSKLPQ